MRVQTKYIFTVFVFLIAAAACIAGISSFLLWKGESNDDISKDMKHQSVAVRDELKYFPIAKQYIDQIIYEDTYGAGRASGSHVGCDLMDLKNEAGRIPIVSATDGCVTNLGWLYLGGYRIGITSKSGIYYYYAHLDSYAENMCVGKDVKAGELLGFMGNTGEGEEGTKDQFDVHLHFGIYIKGNGSEETVNPYPYLKEIEH
ncbi:MAG: M23 family metallopeptidase [Lachnospiraceae bacterium]|nr:M23 family metallopeptidase [Lachnospiraceae bacterium]